MVFPVVTLYVIYLVVLIKGNIIPLPNLDKNTSDICWGDKKVPLDTANIPHILHSYGTCLNAIKNYEGNQKPTLLGELMSNIGCIMSTLNSEYYSGNIGYSIISETNKLLEDIHNEEKSIPKKNILKKDCKSVREVRSAAKNKATPLMITGDRIDKEKACETLSKLQNGKDIENMDIPTPQLDNNKNPTKLKVPTADEHAYSIESPEAGVALTRYYKIVMKCLTLKSKHSHQVLRFNKEMYDWLSQAVVPHLGEDKFYPAFGGVLRILETMKAGDLISDDPLEVGHKEVLQNSESDDSATKIIQSKYFPIILVPWVLVLIFLAVFVAWRSLKLSKCWLSYKDEGSCESDTAILFYPVEESTSFSMTIDDRDDSTYASTVKSDQKSYNTLGQTVNRVELMGVPKKKKHNRQRRKAGFQESNTTSSGDFQTEEVQAGHIVPPLHLRDSTSESHEDFNRLKK